MNIKKRLIISLVGIIIIIAFFTFFSNHKTNKQSKNIKYKIGLAQIVEHPSLNLIRDSFLSKMRSLGYEEGKNIEYLKDSANGEINMLSTIMQKYKNEKVNAIVPIATPTAMAAASYASSIPVVFSAVSDPVGAGLTTTLEMPDKNITGTCDEVKVDEIFSLMKTLFPKIRKIGFIYNTSEANSVSNIKKAKEYCAKNNLNVEEISVNNTSELSQAANVLLSKCDAIFSPNDNTVASGIDSVARACIKDKKPFFVGADSMVADNGFATVGIDYKKVGEETAVILDKVLKGTKVRDIPVKVFNDNYNIYINEGVSDLIGFVIPDKIKNLKNYKPIQLKH